MFDGKLSNARGLLAALAVGISALATSPQLALSQVLQDNNSIGSPQLLGSGIRGTVSSDDDFGDLTIENDGQTSASTTEEDADSQNLPLPLSSRRQQRATAAGRVTSDPDDPEASTLANSRVDPVQTGTGQSFEEDPFAPTGFRLGSFNATSYLEQSVGYSSNISQQANGQGGAFSQTEVGLSLSSDWSRHQMLINLVGSYRLPFDDSEVDEPAFFADSSLRLDLADGYSATSRVYYQLLTEEFGSSTLAPGAVDTPIQQGFGGSLELARDDRKLRLNLRGSLDRNVFEDVDLGGGAIQSQSDRANNLYQLTARVGYEVSPAIVPFVEGVYGIRDFDDAVDRNGNQRDSEITELRGGVELDLGDKLQGEFSIGYTTETFDDPLLADLSGVTLNGQIDWSPQRGSLVSLTAGTTLNNSTTLNDSGSLIYDFRVDYERQVTNRFTAGWFASIEYEDNVDEDTTLEFGVGTEYWLNRHVALTMDLEYLTFTDNTGASDYDEASGRLGVRIQR